jgi:hypothetical protein
MKKAIRVLGLAIVVLLVGSCTTFKIEGAQFNKEMPKYKTVGTFDVTVKVTEWLGSSGGSNFINLTAENMNAPIYEAIQKEIAKKSGDAAINVSIVYQASALDVILNGITGSIYAPAEAHITGTVVKY